MDGCLAGIVDWHKSRANLGSDFWARDFKLIGILGLNADRNWSFKAFAFPVSVKRVWPSFLKGSMPLESCLECLNSQLCFLVLT